MIAYDIGINGEIYEFESDQPKLPKEKRAAHEKELSKRETERTKILNTGREELKKMGLSNATIDLLLPG